MKALIRKPGETVTENDGITGIDWKTGYPLTGGKWFGGPYRMVQNYVPQEDAPETYEEIVIEPEQVQVEEEVVEDEDDYVIIDGKRYSKEELRALL